MWKKCYCILLTRLCFMQYKRWLLDILGMIENQLKVKIIQSLVLRVLEVFERRNIILNYLQDHCQWWWTFMTQDIHVRWSLGYHVDYDSTRDHHKPPHLPGLAYIIWWKTVIMLQEENMSRCKWRWFGIVWFPFFTPSLCINQFIS